MRGNLVLIGAGRFAEEVADLARDAGFSVLAFVEGIDRAKCNSGFNAPPVVWIDDIDKWTNLACALCAVGSVNRAEFIRRAAAAGLAFTTLIHPTAHVSGTSAIGVGTLVSAGAVVAAQCRIGEHVVLNRGALIGHHVLIGDYATLGPGVTVGGLARIGTQTYIGMGGIILDKITVGDHVIVGAGAVVTKDVPDSVQVVGVPARVVRELA
jgi:sugar O-acyltransferase (sialic acid O-acetyltransferase NeuD family)